MHAGGIISLFALVVQAHAELKVMPFRHASLDNTTLNVLANPGLGMTRSLRFNALQNPARQLPYQFAYKQTSGSSMLPNVITRAEAAEKKYPGGQFDWLFKGAGDGNFADPKNAGDQLQDASKVMNAFSEPIGSCKVPDYCLFTEKSPKVCVSFMADGSDNRCVSIFQFSKTNRWRRFWTTDSMGTEYTKKDNWMSEFEGRAIPGLKFDDLSVKCPSLPAAVLDSGFSKDMWNNCEIKFKEYKYVSPKSSKFSAEQSEVVNTSPFVIKKPSLGQGRRPEEIRNQCDQFRDAIEMICNQCASEAPTDGAKSAFVAKCDAIQGGPAAPAEMISQVESFNFPFIALIALVGSSSMLFFFRRTSPAEEAFLAAYK